MVSGRLRASHLSSDLPWNTKCILPTFARYFVKRMLFVNIRNFMKWFSDYVIDILAKLVYRCAAINVLRQMSSAYFRRSYGVSAEQRSSSHVAVVRYNSCSHVLSRCWLEYRLCAKRVLSWSRTRPLLHIWRLVERTAHRKEFRRKRIETASLSLCFDTVV